MKLSRIALPGLAAVAAAIAIVPGTAAATAPNCTGVEAINGQGSTLQNNAQRSIWNGTGTISFNNSSIGCSSTSLPVTYNTDSTHTGSGNGTAEWAQGLNFRSGSTGAALIGTDDALTTGLYTNITNQRTTRGTNDGPLTFPVTQASVAVVVHLPANCTVSGGLGVGTNKQLGLDYATLNGVFTGTINTWADLSTAQPSGAGTLIGTGCSATITRIVRLDASGTSAGFKRFLYQYNTVTTLATQQSDVTTCARGTTGSWQDLSNGPCNQAWPVAIMRASTSGGGGEAASVAATAGSIGYVALPDARANGSFSPATSSDFWAQLPSATLASTRVPTTASQWADPATNGDVAASAQSKCTGVAYAQSVAPGSPGVGVPPTRGTTPSSVNDSTGAWSQVADFAGAATTVSYPACTLTYDLALGKYADYPGTDATEAPSVKTYLTYVVNNTANGGQTAIASGDYAALPGPIQSTSNSGLSLIG